MINRPALARSMRAFVDPDGSVILASPTGDFLVTGAIYSQLIPSLDGEREASEIADAMEGSYSRAEVYFALVSLQSQGCLAEGPQSGIEPGFSSEGEVGILTADDPMWITEAPAGEWTFVSPVTDGYWIGPRFATSCEGPCLHCLQFRLSANRPLAAYARSARLREVTPPRASAKLPDQLLAIAVAQKSPDVIVELSQDYHLSVRHRASRRAECPTCGNPELYADAANLPVTLDHGSAGDNPEKFVRANAALLDPVTGIARSPRKASQAAVHVYIGGANRAHAGSRLADVTHHLRSFASGKGASDTIARASLIGELAERYSATWRGDEPRVEGCFEELYDRAIHPNAVMLYSEAQLTHRDAGPAEVEFVPLSLPAGERIHWSPVWSMTEERHKLVPTALLYFGADNVAGGSYCHADSNGNAAGMTRESAILQGTLELVERDAVGIWWFNGIRRPALALDCIEDEWVNLFCRELGDDGRDVWVLDITTDTGIPAYAAVSRKAEGPEQIVFGFGAHVDARTAAVRALTELGQTWSVASEIMRGGVAVSTALTRWWDTATLGGHSFLAPGESVQLRQSVADARHPAAAFETCRQRIENLGLECMVLDQTRADVGVPAVKMIIPGLRHYRRRLAPGRLYDVPVRMGWQAEVVTEDHLNPEVLAF